MGVLCLGSLFLMAYIDYITGYEVIFFAAYLIPVSMAAWYFDRRTILLMCLASAFAAHYVDQLSGTPYPHGLFRYFNSLTCFVISLVTGLLLHRVKRSLAERKRANLELQRALSKLESSTEQIRKLQDGLQIVCAWTKQIKVGDEWMTPDEFLTTQLKISHGMSPGASREFGNELKRQGREEMQMQT